MRSKRLRPSFVRTIAAAGVAASVAGTVRADPPSRPAACPATAPTRGAACTTPGLHCGYMACGDYWVMNADCQGAPATWSVVQMSCNPPEPTNRPVPTMNPPPPITGVGTPLRPGRHACSFVEDGHRYNRSCTVTRHSTGALQVVAPGTRLNPGNGFSLVLNGAPPAYQAQGTLTAFSRCTGSVHGTVSLEGRGRAQSFRLRFRQCEIAITP